MFNDKASKEFTDKNGDTVTLNIVLLPAAKGIPLATKLMSVAGAALGTENSNLISVLYQVSDKIDFFDIAKTLFAGATVNSSQTSFEDMPLNPDKFFSGNYGQLVDFLAFALEANFGSFFESQLLGKATSPKA